MALGVEDLFFHDFSIPRPLLPLVLAARGSPLQRGSCPYATGSRTTATRAVASEEVESPRSTLPRVRALLPNHRCMAGRFRVIRAEIHRVNHDRSPSFRSLNLAKSVLKAFDSTRSDYHPSRTIQANTTSRCKSGDAKTMLLLQCERAENVYPDA